MKRMVLIIYATILILSAYPTFAGEKKLTIVHSNDLHSHFLGAAPNIDYTPGVTGDDDTLGGWARIATLIKEVKTSRSNSVLVLDAGDFLMGSLFHLFSREAAFELRLMKEMGYDMVALGNHEFDLKPAGLARILTTANENNAMPKLVCANAVFSKENDADNALERLFDQGLVKPYRILEKDGLRIGIFGLIGKDAAEVAPFASPMHFADPVEVARKTVDTLRNDEKVDMVICLSHSGLWADKEKSEDEILAESGLQFKKIIAETEFDLTIETRESNLVNLIADTTGNGLSEIPKKYSAPLGRIVIESSWNPFKLVQGGTYVTWMAVAVMLVLLAVILMIGRFVLRIFRFFRISVL